ncbi:Chaperone protein DNAK [Roseomonas mucosa]|uniref:Heat shock protein 70 n=2 Tax=Roseomonas mucosa TaxID=207340 RepID=A0A379MYU4_9PROT|nr:MULTISPECIES: Hsp70 family protein [Roseomonas]MCG7357848.1 Hsp70 family protein [Roseomonas mucosa]MDT8291456.1 Hsp70 family protein [Roseomonas mucosa]MDT8295939.1 Hsp70 family protein [Roseomonas mucosa]MDT8315877.1 Hsp70 family protein [Roseomonas mucosa]MDT8351948.1 Hsp70 family protein [Roseomonas mucosa]
MSSPHAAMGRSAMGASVGPVLGIDFGTTNSVIATLQPDGSVTTARYAVGREVLDTFRSVLCFWTEHGAAGRAATRHAAGPRAIEAYLEDPLASRLIMSIKSYLAQRSLMETRVFGRSYALDQLVGLLLNGLFDSAGGLPQGAHIVAGRPVRFVGETADDALGEARLRDGFRAAGQGRIQVALEPEAAGHRFASTLDGAATVLVGDFGGGTSDFSILHFEPGPPRRVAPLGHAGVGIAGDALDYRIIDHVVSPRFGKGTSYQIMGKDLPVPPGWYANFARWHRLSLMRAPRTLREIEEVARTADHPERLHHLIRFIEEEAGYALYQAVSGAKAALSRAPSTTLRFEHEGFRLEEEVARADFERWIAPELAQFEAAVDRALADAGLREGEVDRVFLTGGTSLVPAVRHLFERRFGPERVAGGSEFVSVAEGLALIGAEAQDR